jgi:dipeptidyl aminopeptidase/acylaminoacyl peptidase
MTDDRSLERAARSWLEAGPTEAPDHAVEAALLRIQTTPQERDWHVPRRTRPMTMTARLVAAAIAIAVVAVGGAILLRPGGGANVGTGTPHPTVTIAPSAALSPSPTNAGSAAAVDYSTLKGRILVEHLGNALDLSESSATDYNPDTRRFYFMDPADMTSRTAVEFLKGQPVSGKSAADISSDGRKIVFQDWADQTRLYEANLDGTGFRKLPIDCSCALLYPDYDPTGTKIVYVRVQADQSWLEIRDLATNKVTKIQSTVGLAADAVPEQPAWSPDGRTIAFARITWGQLSQPWIGTVHGGGQAPESGVLSLLDVASGKVTNVTTRADLVPGDPNWSPDNKTLVFAAGPFSTTGSVSATFTHADFAVHPDGTGLQGIPGISPVYFPDGQHILIHDGGMNGGADGFNVMLPDYTHELPVNVNGLDLTDLAQGFSYVGHWIDAP